MQATKNQAIVVLVHGIFDTGNVFNKMNAEITKHGYSTFMPSLFPNNGDLGLDELAVQLSHYIDKNIPKLAQFYLVGFSMGGLICRYYLQKLNGTERVKKFITLSSPHYGSKLACFMFNKGCKQMRPKSEFITDLNDNVRLLEKVDVVSIWTPFDLSIIPPSSSSLPVGKEIKLNVLFHPLMLRNQKSIETVVRELSK
jgi:triacylglycerol lipase